METCMPTGAMMDSAGDVSMPEVWIETGDAECPFLPQQLTDKMLEENDGLTEFGDCLFDALRGENDNVHISQLFADLSYMGLREDDPRLRESVRKVKDIQKNAEFDGGDVMLDREMFKKCIGENIAILQKAFDGDFIIPEFQRFCQVIDCIYNKCKSNDKGNVASYIPPLARLDPNYWGVSVCTVDGQRYSLGDVNVPFALQSMSKPLTYAVALNEHGPEYVHQFVGQEPSGDSVNTTKLDSENKPHNPMISAGAIVTVSLVKNQLKMADRFYYVEQEFKKMAGEEYLGFNNAVYLAEREPADRHYEIGHYLEENQCFPDGTQLNSTLDLYFQLSSMEVKCDSAAVIAATLANGGVCPLTGVEVLSGAAVQSTLSIMHSCGMYDYSGQFAFKVGLPAKSGVSGAILLVIPNVMGICMWSPPLDDWKNSCRGIQFCDELVKTINFHQYDFFVSAKRDASGNHKDNKHGTEVYSLLFGAYKGDLSALIRMSVNVDMGLADYDGRTALHLAAAEGHLECVRFLLESCKVHHSPKDRWKHTPLDEARSFEKDDVILYLEQVIERSKHESKESE